MSKQIVVWIPGQPARVTHQSGTRYPNRRAYKTKSLLEWEARLKEGLEAAKPKKPLSGPVQLNVTWGFKAKTKKDIFTYKLTRPDTDNMQKTLKDVMTALGFWKDDSQVVHETCKKLWVDLGGTWITHRERSGYRSTKVDPGSVVAINQEDEE